MNNTQRVSKFRSQLNNHVKHLDPEILQLVEALDNQGHTCILYFKGTDTPQNSKQAAWGKLINEYEAMPKCYSREINFSYLGEHWGLILIPSIEERTLHILGSRAEYRNGALGDLQLEDAHVDCSLIQIDSVSYGSPNLKQLMAYTATWWFAEDWAQSLSCRDEFSHPGFFNLTVDTPDYHETSPILGSLSAGEIGMLAGPGGDGKTAIALELALAVSNRTSALSNEIKAHQYGAVFYFANEESEARLISRIDPIQHKMHIPTSPLYGIGTRGCTDLFSEGSKAGALKQYLLRYRRSDNSLPIKAIFIDPLKDFIEGSENCPEATAKAMKSLRELALTFNCAVIVVHHCNQEGAKNGAGLKLSTIRGHGNLVDYCRYIWMICRAAKQYGPYARYMRLAKNSHGPEGERLTITLSNQNGEPLAEGEDPAGFIKIPEASVTTLPPKKMASTQALSIITDLQALKSKADTVEAIRSSMDITRDTARDLVNALIKSGDLRERKQGRRTVLSPFTEGATKSQP